MKAFGILTLALIVAVPALRAQQPSNSSSLRSLHGTFIVVMSDSEGIPYTLWAQGNDMRLETIHDKQKAISIQRGDTLYSYMEGAKTGTKQHFTSAFASMGLIKQIEEIKANGKQQGSEEIDGVRYDKYEYGSLQDGEMVVVVLSSGTSVPRMWLTAVKTGNNTASLVRTIYRDMSVNVDIPDDTFALPADVMFSEQPKNAPKQISRDQ